MATATSEDMFKWIPRDFNKEADDPADIGCLKGNTIVEQQPIRSNGRFFRAHFDGSEQGGTNGGGWCLEQAWAREGKHPVWKPALKVAISIPTTRLPPYAITAETIDCYEVTIAVLSAVDLGYVTLTSRCRVLRQGQIANMDIKDSDILH